MFSDDCINVVWLVQCALLLKKNSGSSKNCMPGLLSETSGQAQIKYLHVVLIGFGCCEVITVLDFVELKGYYVAVLITLSNEILYGLEHYDFWLSCV